MIITVDLLNSIFSTIILNTHLKVITKQFVLHSTKFGYAGEKVHVLAFAIANMFHDSEHYEKYPLMNNTWSKYGSCISCIVLQYIAECVASNLY